MTDHPDIADHTHSATAQVLADLELHGYRPSASEPDPRDCPEDDLAARAAADILTVLVSAMADTALDWDLDELLWSSVNMFHRAVLRIERKLDDNEQAQKRG